MSENPAALVGRTLAGKFMIEAVVGRGAMGEVYRARHIVLDTVVALKIMRADIAEDAMFKERFYREAKAASRLDHPNSVRVIDFGVEPDGLVYLAMEFLHGRDLLSLLRDEWPLADEQIVDLLAQTLAAVAVAHDMGIVHRDLKPENIMVNVVHDDDGAHPYHVKVCDFGIAKLNDPRGFQTENGKALTSSGTLIGTPEYMSPEQARGDALDARSDVYSIGIVLYQLLVGRVPFTAENALGVVLKQVTDEPVPPSRVRPGVNPRLEAICLRALKKNRDERYQSAKEMRRDLRGVFGYRPQSLPDESGDHPPARAVTFGGSSGDLDPTSVPTIVQGDPETAATQPGPTAQRANLDGTPVDFSPKETSAGTELTVGEASGAKRHRGAIVAVALLALLFGAGAVVAIAKHGSTNVATNPSAAVSASSGAISAANDPPVASSADEASPSSSPLLATADPTTKSKRAALAPPATTPATPAPKASSAVGTAAGSSRATTVALAVPSASAKPGALPVAAADPNYNAAGAYVALGALSRERVREDVLKAKMSAILPKLSECYRSSLMMVGAPQGGSATIHMSIDEKGNVTALVSAAKLPQFARCAQGVLAGTKVPVSALDDAAAGATASQWLDLHP